MLNRPAFFALLGAAGIAAVSYGCQLEEREPPAPNPRPGGGTPSAVGGPGTGSSGGGGGGGGTTTASTTTGGDGGGDGGGGGAQTPAELLFPFCGCLEAGGVAGMCADCLWSVQLNGCEQEDLNCNQGLCLEIKDFFVGGNCNPDITPMCIENAILGLRGGVGDFSLYLDCACTACSQFCAASACQ